MSNPTAFPLPIEKDVYGNVGSLMDFMSLRDYIAAKAMQGLLSNGSKWESGVGFVAYAIADEMLSERVKETKTESDPINMPPGAASPEINSPSTLLNDLAVELKVVKDQRDGLISALSEVVKVTSFSSADSVGIMRDLSRSALRAINKYPFPPGTSNRMTPNEWTALIETLSYLFKVEKGQS